MVNKDSLSYKRGFAKGIEFYTETLKKLLIYSLKTCQPCEQFVKQSPKKQIEFITAKTQNPLPKIKTPTLYHYWPKSLNQINIF